MARFEGFYNDLAVYLREKGVDAARVTGFEDYTYYGGYCETCAYDETRTKILYVTSDGKPGEYDVYMSFAEFLNDITRA